MIWVDNALCALNLVTGSWQVELGLFSSSIWVYRNFATVPVENNPALSVYTVDTGLYVIFYHTFTLLIKLFGIYSKTSFTYNRNTLIQLNMWLTCYLLFRLGYNVY